MQKAWKVVWARGQHMQMPRGRKLEGVDGEQEWSVPLDRRRGEGTSLCGTRNPGPVRLSLPGRGGGSVSRSQGHGEACAREKLCPESREAHWQGGFILTPCPAHTGSVHFSQVTESTGDTLDHRTLASL